METEYEPQPATNYCDSYATTQYRDDHQLAIGAGITAIIVLTLTIIGIVASWQ